MNLVERLAQSTFRFFLVIVLMSSVSAQANLQIEITRGVDDPTKIAIVPFTSASVIKHSDLAAIVAADLERSGRFEILPRSSMFSTPATQQEVFFRDWRSLGVEYLLIGRASGGDELNLVVELFDVSSQRMIKRATLSNSYDAQRMLAHSAADIVYEKITGIRGAFATRMMYVSVDDIGTDKERYRLIIADSDGGRPREMLNSTQPVLSPTWSPDAKEVAYVSFENDRPAIYRQILSTGQREKLTNFKGLNSAPAYSPNGKELAMVLSKDGNPDIYVMDLHSKSLRKVTDHYAIDTEPVWLPDGKSIIFTSDRGRRPQVYQVDIETGKTKRLTFKGDYNAAPDVLPDGKSMVMIHRAGDGFHIAWQELATGRLLVLTESNLDESPSVAPNGSMLLYATKQNGKEMLAAVALDGGAKYFLPSPTSSVREPAWAPVW